MIRLAILALALFLVPSIVTATVTDEGQGNMFVVQVVVWPQGHEDRAQTFDYKVKTFPTRPACQEGLADLKVVADVTELLTIIAARTETRVDFKVLCSARPVA